MRDLLLHRRQHDRVDIAFQSGASRITMNHARRRSRVVLEYRALELVHRAIDALEGSLARQQLVEQHAETIHVARNNDRLTANLLRTRVLRCQQSLTSPSELGVVV